MKERPILFSAPMVRAIMEGRKTQTRRIVKPQPDDDARITIGQIGTSRGVAYIGNSRSGGIVTRMPCPYGKPGDRLWVREAWRVSRKHDSVKPKDLRHERGMTVFFEAGGSRAHDDTGQYVNDDSYPDQRPDWVGKYRPSMFMPRWASRVDMEITGVRVERLQDISEEDAKAEGVLEGTGDFAGCFSCGVALSGTTARECYSRLWAGSWDENPFCWVIDFRAIKQ